MADNTLSLSSRILIALLLGVVTGVVLHALPALDPLRPYLSDGLLLVVGQVFLRGLQLVVVPLVLLSLIGGAAALRDLRQLGRLGGKTALLYFGTTAFAITLAIGAALVVAPGRGMALPLAEFTPKPAPPLTITLINLMPANPLAALVAGDMIQIIVFALLFGIVLGQSGDAGRRVGDWCADVNAVVMRLVTVLLRLAPYGVFCLVARTFSELGWHGIAPLARYFFTVLAVLLMQLLLVYPALLLLLGRVSPRPFVRKMYTAQLFAFSTASSNASLPVTLATVIDKLGVSRRIASFVIPLGATVNMDGTAIMQGVATVFIAQAYGIELGATQYLLIVLMALLASIGTAGVPSAGLIMLTLVFEQVGLPVAGIALIIGVDRLLDMTRTAVNITDDAIAAVIVARSEGELDRDRYNARDPTPPHP